MSEFKGTSTIEIQQVRRIQGQSTMLKLQLKSEGSVRDFTIMRGLDPKLFDFIAEHATTTESPN